jgi:hypothetical protein
MFIAVSAGWADSRSILAHHSTVRSGNRGRQCPSEPLDRFAVPGVRKYQPRFRGQRAVGTMEPLRASASQPEPLQHIAESAGAGRAPCRVIPDA